MWRISKNIIFPSRNNDTSKTEIRFAIKKYEMVLMLLF